MQLRHLFTFTLLVVVACSPSRKGQESSNMSGTAKSSDAFTRIDSLINEAVYMQLIPGAVLSVVQYGSILYEKAYGNAQVRNDSGHLNLSPPPMSIRHRFDLASLTKVFATTFGIMLLVDSHQVILDEPVYTYLPSFKGPVKDSVTVRHLLTHTAGLYQWKPIYYHANTPKESLSYICNLPLAFPVGKERHYSDLGFMLLGYIIEKVSSQSLDQFLKEHLYYPLQLKNTSFNPPMDGPPFAATSQGNPFERHMVEDDEFGYLCDEDPKAFNGWRNYVLMGEVNDGNSFYANGGIAGHAGLFSTAGDLNVLLDLLLHKGVHNGTRYLSEAVVQTFLTKTSFGHGLGWAMSTDVIPVDSLPMGSFGHTGFTGTYAVVFPSLDLSIVLLTNRQNMGVNKTGYYPSVTPLRKNITELILKEFR